MAVLKKGSKGSGVKALQKKLNGFKAKLAVDGDFGPATDKAVREFQKASGLRVDGMVGKNTMAALDLKTGGGGAAGKKSSGGGGVSLVDWKVTHARDREKRFLKAMAPYPRKHKQRKKDHAAFMARLNVHMAMSQGDKGKVYKKVRELEGALDKTWAALDRCAAEFGGYLGQFTRLVERYNSLSKAGKMAAALELGTEVNRQNGLYKGLANQWASRVADYDFAHDNMIAVQRAMEKEMG